MITVDKEKLDKFKNDAIFVLFVLFLLFLLFVGIWKAYDDVKQAGINNNRKLLNHCDDVALVGKIKTRLNMNTQICEVWQDPYWVSLNEYKKAKANELESDAGTPQLNTRSAP